MPSTRSRTCRVPMVDGCWHLGSALPEPPGGGQEGAAPLTAGLSSCRGLGEWPVRDRPWAGPVPVVLSWPSLLGKARPMGLSERRTGVSVRGTYVR